MDILFKNDHFVFSYRVGGILKHNGKILLQRPKNDDYAIIGGHVAAMETSMETLKREFEEELHAKIEVDNLLAIGEIYFPWGKRPCHQICLYYNVHLMDDNIPLDGVFYGYDELDNERIHLDFCWLSLEDLKKDMDNIKIYMSRPSLFDIPDDVQIRFNDSDIVTGGKGYNAWWGKEYERREADDL